MFASARGRRFVLLQGPMGPFFRRVGAQLRADDAHVTQVAFNSGDALFLAGVPFESYRGDLDGWPRHLDALFERDGIDSIAVFGDQRPYHRLAIEAARARGLQVWVFEEGYLRPDHITLERNGTNARSEVPTDATALTLDRTPVDDVTAHASGTFLSMTLYSIGYVLALRLGRIGYPNYRHHRDVRAIRSGLLWLRGAYRKQSYGLRERHMTRRLTVELTGRYFLAPLQVHCDSQVADSQFADVEQFIRHTADSFARAADQGDTLVFKHHPLDRPYRDYSRLVTELANTTGLGPRLQYVHDLHLPTLLRNARGTVVMNSTVGLSSLVHGTPTKALDRAIYNIEGLTHQGELDAFWRSPTAVDGKLFQRLRQWLLAHNQFNGSFYRRLPGVGTPTGVRFAAPGICAEHADGDRPQRSSTGAPAAMNRATPAAPHQR